MDVYQRRGTYPRNLPFVPGPEGVGVVEAVGEDVKNLKLTDRVAYTGKLVLTPSEPCSRPIAAYPCRKVFPSSRALPSRCKA